MHSEQSGQLHFDEFRWADISVPDVAAAKAFYTSLFGWHYADRIVERRAVYSHAFLSADARREHPVAGIAPLWQGQSENSVLAWHPHILVENADQTLARMTDAGGTIIVPPMDIMDAGRMAICCDTVGSSMVVWQPYSYFGAEVLRQPATIAWFELITDRPEDARCFYQQAFGWKSYKITKNEADYWMFYLGQRLTGGMQTDSAPTDGSHHWCVYFRTEDLGKCLEDCAAQGGQVAYGPRQEPAIGSYAVCTDNQGQRFGLIQIIKQ